MTYPPLTELLPHRPPMLWLDEVLDHDAEAARVRCALTLRSEHAFVREGRAEPLIAIEWMAQAIGALVGLRDRAQGQAPRAGFLIAVPEALFDTDGFALGERLEITATRIWGDDQLASFGCEVWRGASCVARAQISVYRRDKEGGAP